MVGVHSQCTGHTKSTLSREGFVFQVNFFFYSNKGCVSYTLLGSRIFPVFPLPLPFFLKVTQYKNLLPVIHWDRIAGICPNFVFGIPPVF